MKDYEKDGFNLIYEDWDNISIFKKPTFGEISLLLQDIPLNNITRKTKELLELKDEKNICFNDISNNSIGHLYKCISYINNGNNYVEFFNFLNVKIKDIAENSKPDEYKLIFEDIKSMITKSNEEKINFIFDNDIKMRKYINIKYTQFSSLFEKAIDGINENNYFYYNKYCELLIDFSKGYVSAYASILIILEELFDRSLHLYFDYNVKDMNKTFYNYIADLFDVKYENIINKEIIEYYTNNDNFLNIPTFSDFVKKDFIININEKPGISYKNKILIIGRLDKKDICILNKLANDYSIYKYHNEFSNILWFYGTLFKTPDSFRLGCEYGIISNCDYKIIHIITNYNNTYFYLQKDYYSFRKSFIRDFKIQYFYNSFALVFTLIALLISFTGIIQVIQGFVY